jgi:arylsulfatase A-like enzyme
MVAFSLIDTGKARRGDAQTPMECNHDSPDGGIRVPLIARWPGKIKPAAVSGQAGYFGDMLATFCELAGVPLPAGRDSLSLVPTLLGKGTQKQHEYLYWEFHEAPGLPGGKGFSQAVLLEGRWKGIRMYRRSAPIVLYDLKNDLSEKQDVAGTHSEIVERIARLMQTARSDSPQWPIVDAPEPGAKSGQ